MSIKASSASSPTPPAPSLDVVSADINLPVVFATTKESLLTSQRPKEEPRGGSPQLRSSNQRSTIDRLPSRVYVTGELSRERREGLHLIDGYAVPVLNNRRPITQYFRAAHKVRKDFDIALEELRLDDAYFYGLRFCKLATKKLPYHIGYRSGAPALRQQNRRDLAHVCLNLVQIVKRMDLEELQQRQNLKSQCESSVIECPICYGEYPVDQFIPCRDGGVAHVFCQECVTRYAREMIFGSGTLGTHKETKEPMMELKCIHESCSSVFQQRDLNTVLTQKEMERYGELQWTLNVERAGLENLGSCPKCGNKVELPATARILHCPKCRFDSCVHCGEAPHGNLGCAQAHNNMMMETEKTRHKMEEEMTAALVRKCPNPACGKPMVKEGGCNKLTCSCGWRMCNVCKGKVTGYEHFCQEFECTHEECGKCSLWTSTETADKKAIDEAYKRGQAELENLKKRRREGNDTFQQDASDDSEDELDKKRPAVAFAVGNPRQRVDSRRRRFSTIQRRFGFRRRGRRYC